MKILDQKLIKSYIKPRERDCNKGDFGKLLIVSSCACMSGALQIATKAALRCGVGLCTAASVDDALLPLRISTPEAITLPLPSTKDGKISKKAVDIILDYAKGCSALVLGCGLSVCEDTEILLEELFKKLEIPTVLDADGINIAARNINILRNTSTPLILTPHLKEMSRLIAMDTPEIKENKIEVAKEFAHSYNCTLVLKDFESVIANPDGEIFKNTAGHPCMAKGGSGDMLAGMIGAFLAQGFSLKEAANAGVYLHAKAGEICGSKMGDLSVLASDMIKALPEVFTML